MQGVKLLDFGLAKELAPEPGLVSTATFDQQKLTAEGSMIGTFQYMAPEQLEGRPVDARTDVFAFGVLLYEMATGRKAFEGESHASLIASILTSQPLPISATRRVEDFPPALDHIIERCLQKKPPDRWQTTRDIKLELEWAMRAGTFEPRPRSIHRGRVRPTLCALPGWTPACVRATRDGRRHLWVRSLGSLDARPLAGTDDAQAPFWSPDSRFIGFFADGAGELRRVDLSGGPPRRICAAQSDGNITWGRDGTILFTQFRDGLYRVSADGGTPVRVTSVDKSQGEMNHYWPEFLPDGRHFFFLATAVDPKGNRLTPTVYVSSIDDAPNEP